MQFSHAEILGWIKSEKSINFGLVPIYEEVYVKELDRLNPKKNRVENGAFYKIPLY